MKTTHTIFLAISTLFFISTSIIILAYYPLKTGFDYPLRKPLIGIMFISICAFGTVAAYFPSKCTWIAPSKNSSHDKRGHSGMPAPTDILDFRGHHPTCGRYADHTLAIGNHCLCAACTGLLIGGLIAIILAILYFFERLAIPQPELAAVLIGQILVNLGLAQFKFKSLARLTVNVLFVLGALFSLIGVDQAGNSFALDLYLLAAVIYWILIRIQISNWDHSRTCQQCNMKCSSCKR
jgi:hypothetical protein